MVEYSKIRNRFYFHFSFTGDSVIKIPPITVPFLTDFIAPPISIFLTSVKKSNTLSAGLLMVISFTITCRGAMQLFLYNIYSDKYLFLNLRNGSSLVLFLRAQHPSSNH